MDAERVPQPVARRDVVAFAASGAPAAPARPGPFADTP